MESKRYKLPETGVIAQAVEGEAMIICPATGVYYNLNPTATFIWDRLLDGECESEIAARFTAPGSSSAVAELVLELLQEKLLEDRGGLEVVTTSANPPAYEDPTMEAFRDMGDLLALDPPAPHLGDVAWKGE